VVMSATRVAFMSASVASDSIITVGSNVVVNQSVTIVAASSAAAAARRIGQSPVPFICSSQFNVTGRLKWETEADTPETWTPIEDTPEIWTPA
jgi:hypothetical protein